MSHSVDFRLRIIVLLREFHVSINQHLCRYAMVSSGVYTIAWEIHHDRVQGGKGACSSSLMAQRMVVGNPWDIMRRKLANLENTSQRQHVFAGY